MLSVNKYNFMKKKVKTVVFPVGGLGTRFLPATKATPKEMLPVAEKPLIQYAFEEAVEAGIEKFIFMKKLLKQVLKNLFLLQEEIKIQSRIILTTIMNYNQN